METTAWFDRSSWNALVSLTTTRNTRHVDIGRITRAGIRERGSGSRVFPALADAQRGYYGSVSVRSWQSHYVECARRGSDPPLAQPAHRAYLAAV
jgi:hypothetical protein